MDTVDTGAIQLLDLAAQRARLGGAIEEAMARVVAHGRFIMGPEVAELEERLAAYSGARHAVSCSSGTDALLLPLLAWEVRPGDAVFVPAFTFPATPEVVALLGATPVFVDVEPDTFNIDVNSLRSAIEVARAAGLRPRGVIAVDLFGQPADYGAVQAIADKFGFWVLSDAAQSFGATTDGRGIGHQGDAVATSFFPAKPLGCYGDGGAVLTNDDDLAEAMRSARVHGQGAHRYDIVRVGINGRLDTLQAAVLLAKLEIFDEELRARAKIAERYTTALAELVQTPTVRPGVVSAWAQYTIALDNRDHVAAHLSNDGVPTAIYYPKPLHQQEAYAPPLMASAGLPASEALSGRVLSLPVHPYLTDADVERVLRALSRAAVT